MKQFAEIKIFTFYRDSTKEWVGVVDLRANDHDVSARYTGATEEAARNAAIAAVGYQLLETTFF